MFRIPTRSRTALLLAALIGPAAAPAFAADRTATEIVKEIDAARSPSFDPSRRSDKAYVEQVRKQFMETGAKRDALILELFHADADHPRLPELMMERWRRLPPVGADEAKLQKEVQDVLARTHNEKLRIEALFARAQAGLFKTQQSGKSDLAGVEEFVKAFPKDMRAEQLLYYASLVSQEPAQKSAYENRLLAEYPKSKVAEAILGTRRQLESVGKPFDLDFTDAISGSSVSMKALRGKVVVIDFWATWCQPCIAELPHMKELYGKYRDQGVEFIGVSLDSPKEQGGLDSLKAFVQKNEIRWPQYYMGKGWESDFSRSWGINAIPAVFVVDTDGNLASVQARGKLDQMIPDLLAKKGGGARRPAGG